MNDENFNQLNRPEQVQFLLKNEEPWTDRYVELAEEMMEIEKIRMDDFELASFLADVDITRKAVMNDIEANGNLKKNVNGKVPCPVCEDGVVTYLYSGSYNGHIGAKCVGCNINWQE